VPMSTSDLAKVPAASGPVIQVPDTLGGVSVSYNLPGVTNRIRLDAPTLAGIFAGTIKTWNASQIAAQNPGVTLPSNAITPEVRADSSGTTYIFTDYLAKAAPSAWTLGTSKTIPWPPSAVQSPHTSGVAASIKSTPYSIGYVELAYARENKLPYASVQNAAGNFVEPTIESVTAAAAGVVSSLPATTDFRLSIVNAPGAQAYPISSFTYLLLPTHYADAAKGKALVDFVKWAIHDGERSAPALDYAPLPSSIVTMLDQRLSSMQLAESR
jgi:phosphate transport system substrate-binding protein